MNEKTRRHFSALGLNGATATIQDVLDAYERLSNDVRSNTESDGLVLRQLEEHRDLCIAVLTALGADGDKL